VSEIIRLAEADIQDGDLLLLRGRGPLSRLIERAGRSPYSHAAMAAWWDKDLMLLEMVGSGGRAVTLESQVRRYAARWDWFRLKADRWGLHRKAVVAKMRAFAGVPYGWGNLLLSATYHLPLLRLFARPAVDDCANGRRMLKPICSQAIAASLRLCGVDPVPGLADYVTEPSDLARSVVFARAGTLVL